MKKKILILSGTILLLIISITLYSRFIATKGIVVKEYKITSDNVLNSFHGLKIVHFSDLHYLSTFDKKDLEQLVQKINEIKPDVIVFTGDLMENNVLEEGKDDLIHALQKMQATLKKYAISGNHDKEGFKEIMQQGGFIILDEQYDLIYQNGLEPILIAGSSSNLNDPTPITEKIKPTIDYINNHDISYKILLLHEPDYIDEIDKDKFNLILAGHSHGGQIRLPWIGSIITPNGAKKYKDFSYKINNTEIFVSSGLGTSTIPFRLFNHPSINLYRLTNH